LYACMETSKWNPFVQLIYANKKVAGQMVTWIWYFGKSKITDTEK
jgi:hypothetical protein